MWGKIQAFSTDLLVQMRRGFLTILLIAAAALFFVLQTYWLLK